ncbi:hypothetical protein ACIOWE_13600 [Pseudomonas sp. NPDC087598]|uniref:hypothetical protein n=1 Tax=Pseudomonas sp. NPDC087598 TaxID=3364440 RepID=UPI0037F7F561
MSERNLFGERSRANSMSWADTIQAYDRGELGLYVDRGLALRAASNGLKTGALGPICGIAAPFALIAGVAMAFLMAWWWCLIGAFLCWLCFRVSRSSAIRAVRKAVLENQAHFYALRDLEVVCFERIKS